MLEVIAFFLIILGVISLVTTYSVAGVIYSILIMSLIVALNGLVRGNKVNTRK